MNFEQYTSGKIYALFDFIYKLIMINVLWLFTAMLGFGILTIFPATVAMFILLNSSIRDQEFPLLRSFFNVFKGEYVRSQKLFIILFLLGALIVFDLVFFVEQFLNNQTVLNSFLVWIIILTAIFYGMILVHIIPVYLYFPKLSTTKMLKLAGLFSIRYLFHSLFLLILHVGIITLTLMKPVFIPIFPLFYFSLMAYITLRILGPKYQVFLKEKTPLEVKDYWLQTEIEQPSLLDLKQCRLIAHRGLSGFAPENSLSAFRLAAEKNYFAIEADIHTTKDGYFVMFHDTTLTRMTGIEANIHEMTLEDINDIRLTSGHFVDVYSDEKIPLLQEYLQVCHDENIVPVAEIKYVHDEKQLDELVERIQAFGLYNHTIIISFNLDYLIYLRERYPDLNIQYLVGEITPDVINTCQTYRFDVDVNYGKLTREQIEQCHEAGLLVNVWTVDDPEIAQRLIDQGADFITTNCLY